MDTVVSFTHFNVVHTLDETLSQQTDKHVTISAQRSPQISASVPHSRHLPLRWEHCSTPPPPGPIAYTWTRERGRIRERKIHSTLLILTSLEEEVLMEEKPN